MELSGNLGKDNNIRCENFQIEEFVFNTFKFKIKKSINYFQKYR